MKTKIIALSVLLISSFSFNADASSLRKETRDLALESAKVSLCEFDYADESNIESFRAVQDKIMQKSFDAKQDIHYFIKMTLAHGKTLKAQYVVTKKIANVMLDDDEATKANLFELCESILD